MNPLEEVMEHCPYCGETIALLLDRSEFGNSYTEDCQVCCRPMVLQLTLEGNLTIKREDEV
jgi:hypothetical protein